MLFVCFAASSCSRQKPLQNESNTLQLNAMQDMPFEVISAKRIDLEESHTFGDHVSFSDTNTGVVMVVLKSKLQDGLVYYSTDFSIGYDSSNYATEIPRESCLGISDDVSDSAGQDWNWLLSGGVSRSRTEPGKPYFAVVFSAPENVSEFTLYYATPAGAKIKLEK